MDKETQDPLIGRATREWFNFTCGTYERTNTTSKLRAMPGWGWPNDNVLSVESEGPTDIIKVIVFLFPPASILIFHFFSFSIGEFFFWNYYCSTEIHFGRLIISPRCKSVNRSEGQMQFEMEWQNWGCLMARFQYSGRDSWEDEI